MSVWDVIKHRLGLAEDTPEPETEQDFAALFPQKRTDHPTTRLEEPTPADVDADDEWDYTSRHWYKPTRG